MILVDLEHIRR